MNSKSEIPLPRWCQPIPPRPRYLLDDVPHTGNELSKIPWNEKAVAVAKKREANRLKARSSMGQFIGASA